VVPDIETIVEIDGALRDAEGLIKTMRLLLESASGQYPDETFTEAARDITWIALEKIAEARKRMEAPEKQATTGARHEHETEDTQSTGREDRCTQPRRGRQDQRARVRSRG
jgi:hypothetical protein